MNIMNLMKFRGNVKKNRVKKQANHMQENIVGRKKIFINGLRE